MSSVQNHSKNGDEGAAAALQTTLAGKPPTTSELQATTKDELNIINSKSGDMKSSCLLGILGGSDMAAKNPNKRRHSTDSIDSSTTRVSNLEENREDDDNDDDDDDDRLQALDVDPERLKAFNMFVRLFVDENLDRVIPISKQPKDKVQAILEACDRQFPEFQERSRKRIRTYLKSCRRLKRSKDSNVWEQAKPAPHLTSAAAEGILAQACENESQNAKRMRMGLEPLSACVMNANATMGTLNCGSIQSILTQTDKLPKHGSPSHEKSFHDDRSFIEHKEVKCAHDLPSSNLPNGSSSSLQFRPPPPPRMPVTHNALTAAQDPYSKLTQNGPTDLRVKYKAVENGDFQKTKNNLNPTEMATIRQLIAGYRESAAFLYRSADELEQLLLQKN